MGKEAYDILGIIEQQLGTDGIDLTIRGNFRERLSEQLAELNEILDSDAEALGEDENDTDSEGLINNVNNSNEKSSTKNAKKLRKIDRKIHEMFKSLCAYMKIMTKEAREEYEKGKVSTVEEDMANMQKNLRQVVKIEYRTGNNNSKTTLSNAYQILGISEKLPGMTEEEIDDKVETKTMVRMKMRAGKKIPYNMEEAANMIFMLQRDIWAYSKINTTQNRKNYNQELNCQRVSEESKKYDTTLGIIQKERCKSSDAVQIHQTDGGETFSIAQTGKLVNKVLLLEEGSTNQYALERNYNGEKSHIIFYGNIDMERLKTDSEYREFWKDILFSEKTILFSKKYLGGYIGEAKSTILKVEEKQKETFTITHNPKRVAMCKKYQRERTKRKQTKNNISSPGEEPQGGEMR